MRAYKWLLFGGCIMFIVASISLLSEAHRVFAGGEVCSGGNCSVTDTTLADFAQGSFYATGLRNQFDGEVQLLPIGITAQWLTDTNKLPGRRTELVTAIYKDIIYVIGGVDESNVTKSEIFSATTLVTGAISASGWTTPTSLPSPRVDAASAISVTQNGAFLYIIGGSTGSAFTTTVLYHSLDANGAFTGSWSTTFLTDTYLTIGSNGKGLVNSQAVVHNGFLYVLGGEDGNSIDHNQIIRAPINSDGSLGAWVFDTAMPAALSSHAAAVWASGVITDYLYVMGGLSSGTQQAAVYISSLDNNGSFLGSFTSSGFPLPLSVFGHSATQGSGEIFVSGGYQGNSAVITNSVQSNLVDSAGQFDANWVTSLPLPQARAYHGTVINSGGEVFVIAGADQSNKATDTVYHGSTSGFGANYAPAGTFTSRIVNLGALRALSSLVANTTITSSNATTLTLQYRTATSQDLLLAAAWLMLGNAPTGTSNISTTFPLSNPNASYVQYRGLYTNTSPFDSSPALNAFQINYPINTPTPTWTATATITPTATLTNTPTSTPTATPTATPTGGLPDFIITSMQAPPAIGITTTRTITITILNKGTANYGPVRLGNPLSTPVLRQPSAERIFPSFSSPSGYSGTTNYYFWVAVYIDHVPTGAADVGNCKDQNGALTLPYVYSLNLPMGGSIQVKANCWVTGGPHTFYAQADVCDSPPDLCSPTYGYIYEKNESNNVIGPVMSGNTISGIRLYLPMIRR